MLGLREQVVERLQLPGRLHGRENAPEAGLL